MKKSILAITLLTAMMAMPMSMNAETMMDVPTCEQPSNSNLDLPTEAEFDRMIHRVICSGWDEFKWPEVKEFLEKYMMNKDEIYRVALEFSTDEYKLKFLKNAYEHCVDYEDYYDKMHGVFHSDNSRDELKKYIDNY